MLRLARRLAMIAVTGVAVALSTAPAATAATVTPAASLLGTCKPAPLPQLPGSGVPGEITGPPITLPPPGSPFGPRSRTSEYNQYGFADLSWHTYDLGCFHVFGIPDMETWVGNGLLWAAKVVVRSTMPPTTGLPHPDGSLSLTRW